MPSVLSWRFLTQSVPFTKKYFFLNFPHPPCYTAFRDNEGQFFVCRPEGRKDDGMTEEYALYDENGTFVARRRVLYRLKLLMESGKTYTVRGDSSGLELKVTTETPSQDWRSFEDRVLEDMDAFEDFVDSLIEYDSV